MSSWPSCEHGSCCDECVSAEQSACACVCARACVSCASVRRRVWAGVGAFRMRRGLRSVDVRVGIRGDVRVELPLDL
eukprot:4337989-Pleurochrysis_carterae.AAC.2